MTSSDLLAKLERIIANASPSPQKVIHLEIPIKCKPKARPRTGKTWGGKKVWYSPTSEHEYEIALLALGQMRKNGWEAMSGKIKLSCTIYLRGDRLSDISNYIKSIEDALEGKKELWPLCYYNDYQIGEYGQVKTVERAESDLIIVDLEEIGSLTRKVRRKK